MGISKIKNLPKKIFLCFGEIEGNEDFKELHGVSWCEDKINEFDAEFVRVDVEATVMWQSELAKHIEFVFEHEEDFLAKFIRDVDFAESLEEVYFASERMMIVYLSVDGDHIIDSVMVEDYLRWARDV